MVAKQVLSFPLAAFVIAVAPVFALGQQSLDELPPDLGRSLREAVLESAYRVDPVEIGRIEALNPAQKMRGAFTAQGVQVSGADGTGEPGTASFVLVGWGREDAMHAVEPAEPTAHGRRVEYRRGALIEWYVNDPRGLEQGFTVDDRPEGGGPLEIVLSIGGGLEAEIAPGARDALLTDRVTGRAFHYSGLRAWDATGRELDASLAAECENLSIRIKDEGAAYPLQIDPWIATEEAKLIASDATVFDYFGVSVAVSGDTAVVGAYEDDHAGKTDAGSAYVFVRSGMSWSEQQKLVASDAGARDYFGRSVAVSGDTIVVGSSEDNGAAGLDAGSAYVFVRSGGIWSEEQKLTASDGGTNDMFGISVAVSGDTALVGAWLDDTLGGFDTGSAYVFVRSGTTWSEQQKLTASDGGMGDLFGVTIAVSGETALVGATKHDLAGAANAGSAYVFVRNGTTWSEQQELIASDGGSDDNFGSVAISGDTAVIGANWADHTGIHNAGSAYVFVRSGTTWAEEAKLTASDAMADDVFGGPVAVLGDLAVVGAMVDDMSVPDVGSVYVFVRSGTTWTEEAKLGASDASANDRFGASVALSDDTVLVGAYLDDPAGTNDAGSVYVFHFSLGPVTYCTAGTSASGCQALLSAAGSASATAPSGFTITAATVEGQKDGLFFFGTNGQQANPWGNGTSYQCVIPPVVRTPTTAGVGTIGLCDGTFALDLNALWCPSCPKPGKNPGPGATVQAQLWYRDPLSTSNQTTSLSDAVEFGVAP